MIRELGSSDAPLALDGPSYKNLKVSNKYLPHATKKWTDYTLGILWDDLTPGVTARIIRDVFQLAHVCRVNRINLKIATTSTALDGYLKFLDVSRTTDNKAATYWRVYYTKEVADVEIPDHAELSDLIRVKPDGPNPQRLVLDPTFPAKVEYIDVHQIHDTVPLFRTPPTGPADYNMQEPF